MRTPASKLPTRAPTAVPPQQAGSRAIVDNRPTTVAQRQLLARLQGSEQVQTLTALQQAISRSSRQIATSAAPVQRVVNLNGVRYGGNFLPLHKLTEEVKKLSLSPAQVQSLKDQARDSRKIYEHSFPPAQALTSPELLTSSAAAERELTHPERTSPAPPLRASSRLVGASAAVEQEEPVAHASAAHTSAASASAASASAASASAASASAARDVGQEEVTQVAYGAVAAASQMAHDLVLGTHASGRLLVHMVTGTLTTTPTKGPQNAWQHDLAHIFHPDRQGLIAASSSLIPHLAGTSGKRIYSAPFGLLTTTRDEDILAMAGRDLGINATKNNLDRTTPEAERRTTVRNAAARLHADSLVDHLELLNNRSRLEHDKHSPNNEVVYDIKPANLLGILINVAAIRGIPGMASSKEELGTGANRRKNVTTAVQAIREHIQRTYGLHLPIYQSSDGGKNIGPFEP